jgi:DNA methyltransferase 1-associated protein 1
VQATNSSLGHRRERKFVHQGRKDGLQLSHWVTVDENSEAEDKGIPFSSLHVLPNLRSLRIGDYPFAKYSTPTTIYNYGDDEYTKYLEGMFFLPVELCTPFNRLPDERETGWSKAETDYLFRLLNDYALRFYIVADRYEWPGSERHVEDLKARYYAICRKLFKVRPLDSPTEQENRNTGTVQYGFDYGEFCNYSRYLSLIPDSPAKEKSRREFIENLWNRDPATVAEEDILYLDLKRLEQTERKFARERDTLLRNLAGIESGLSGIDIQEDGLVGWGGNPADHPQPKRQGGRNRKSLRSAADLDYELSSHPGSNMVISLGGSLPNRNLMPPAQQAAFGKWASPTPYLTRYPIILKTQNIVLCGHHPISYILRKTRIHPCTSGPPNSRL